MLTTLIKNLAYICHETETCTENCSTRRRRRDVEEQNNGIATQDRIPKYFWPKTLPDMKQKKIRSSEKDLNEQNFLDCM